MIFRRNYKTSLLATILIASLVISASSAFAQSSAIIEIDLTDLKEMDRRLRENEILKRLTDEQVKTIAEIEKSLALAQKEIDLEGRENEINKRIIQVKDMEIASLNHNFDQMKEVSDRALKLAEVGKPKSNWELQGLLGAAAFALGVLVGK